MPDMMACWTSLLVANRLPPRCVFNGPKRWKSLGACQGCREDGPVPPNCSTVTTHVCGWLCVLLLSKAVHQTQTCFCDMTLAPTPQHVGNAFQLVMCPLVTEIWSHYAPQCLTMFPPALPSYNWRWDSKTDMRRGPVSVRGSSALPALTWQEIWMK
jgi:hypothetical protein